MKGKILITCEDIIFGFTEKLQKIFLKFQTHFLPVIKHTSKFFSWFNILNITYGQTIYTQTLQVLEFSPIFSIFKSFITQVREKLLQQLRK